MPRGEPRSVPDPEGEAYDEMLRQKRLREAIEDATAAPESFTYPDHSLDFLRQPPRPEDPTAKIDGQVSRCVVQDTRPPLSPSELAAQRAALGRVSFMADHPLAGAAYGLAALAGGPPRVRDGALMLGGLVDTAMLGAAPFGAQTRGEMAPPGVAPAPERFERPNIRYGAVNKLGQASGVTATVAGPMLGTGTKAYWRRTPPGWQGDGNKYNEARGHLLANRLGGSGSDIRNLVTLTHNGANTPRMRGFEDQVARRVAAGEVVEYSATPIYDSGVLPPSSVLVTAHGTRGAPSARFIPNPAGRPR